MTPLRRSAAVVGTLSALGALLIWALFPAFFKLLSAVPPIEILAYRIVWSLVFGGVVLVGLGRLGDAARALRSPRLVATLTASALVLSLNWGVFLWAVANDHVLDSSLGYFMSPLGSVLLAVVVLKERLRRAQWVAVGLAGVGVAYEVVGLGGVPWVALTLAMSWACYGLVRKTAAVDSLAGLVVETLLMTPLALGYLVLLAAQGGGAFGSRALSLDLLLALSGVVTAIPLILFVAGAKRIRLTTLGLLQYVVPTGHFLLAVFAFGEPFAVDRLISFAWIWGGLVVYSADAMRRGADG